MHPVKYIAMEIRPKQAFKDWLIETVKDEAKIDKDRPLSEFRKLNTIYLIPQFDNENDIVIHLMKHCREIFESELSYWHKDKSKWPKSMEIEDFKLWFDFRLHPHVIDLTKGELPKS